MALAVLPSCLGPCDSLVGLSRSCRDEWTLLGFASIEGHLFPGRPLTLGIILYCRERVLTGSKWFQMALKLHYPLEASLIIRSALFDRAFVLIRSMAEFFNS